MLSVICNAQKKYSKGNPKKIWKTTNYKTGDIPNCLKFIPSIVDKKMDNFLKINNDSNQDAVIKLVKLDYVNKTEVTSRVSFIEKHSKYKIKNIPSGKYYLKIAYGTAWKEKANVNESCSCRFSLNPKYEKGKVLDFTPIKKQYGTDIPSYSVIIDSSLLKQTPPKNDLYYHDFGEEIFVDSSEKLKAKE